MKTIIIAILMTHVFVAHAKSSPPKSRPQLPSNTTQTIFESLEKSQNPAVTFKAPMEINAEDVVCTVGSGAPHTPQCVAAFKDKDKVIKKPIENSEKFFNSLEALNAISLDEMMYGGNVYKAKSITCTYKQDSPPYYRCTSEISVRF